MDDIIEINTDQMEPITTSNDLYANRTALAHMRSKSSAEVTVVVIAYNRLEKTKRCISSILAYSQGVDYELVLVDNGSTDETLEYLKSVPYPKKRFFISRKILEPLIPARFCTGAITGILLSFWQMT